MRTLLSHRWSGNAIGFWVALILTLLAVAAACCGLLAALFVLPYGKPWSACVLLGIAYASLGFIGPVALGWYELRRRWWRAPTATALSASMVLLVNVVWVLLMFPVSM